MVSAKLCQLISVVCAAKYIWGGHVNRRAGSTVLLRCNVAQNSKTSFSSKHIWLFDDIIVFGGGYNPIDVGFKNVRVALVNDTVSYLQIDCISTANEGNYTCKFEEVALANYTLKVSGTANSVVKSAMLNSNVSLTCCFQGNHVWKFNGSVVYPETFKPSDIEINNIHGEKINHTFTSLHIEKVSWMNVGQYSCTIGGVNVLQYTLTVHDIKLYLNGQNASEVQYLTSGVNYSIECSIIGTVKRMNFSVSLWVSTHHHLNYTKTALHNQNNGSSEAEITAVFPSTADKSLLMCLILDGNNKGFGVERRSLDVNVIPQLIIQKNGKNLTSYYKAVVGEILELNCVAFGARPAVALTWKSTDVHNLSFTETSSKQNDFQKSTVNYESQLKQVVEKSMILTCCGIGKRGIYSLNTQLEIEIDGSKELYFIVVVAGILVIAAVLILILQIRLRLQNQRRENAELFALSIWQKTTSSLPNGDVDVSMVKFDTTQGEKIRKKDDPIQDKPTTAGYTISSQSASLLTQVHAGECKEYWLGSYSTGNGHRKCICETVSEQAQMKDAYNFLSLIERLSHLPSHSNVVSYLGSCTDEVPYYVYREYMDNGLLRDFLLRNYRSHRSEDVLSSYGADNNFEQAKPHPITFARDVAEAMYFLHNYQFNHPALSARKVLLDGSLMCKLFDFWPTELTNERVSKLTNSSNPPTGWFPPETIFLGRYDTLSDVWAYGIFLWELFSLGEVPFQFKTTKEIEDDIRNMVQLPQPQTCPGAMYGIMLSTWNKYPESRPLLEDIIHQIHYLQENMASGTVAADGCNEWDEWNND